MGKVAVVAELTAADGKRDELIEAFGSMFEAVSGEDKTEIYAVHKDAGDANIVWFYELYTDQDGLTAHSTSDAMKAAGGALGGLLAGRPELFFLEPVRAKGLSL